MSTVVCPNGHHSADAEWCDTCGAPIEGSANARAAATPTPTGAPVSAPHATPTAGHGATPSTPPQTDCPNCGLSNDAASLFCEQCGYDFTTGQAPPKPSVVEPSEPASLPDSSVKWVVVVEVDPVWYALKGSLADQPCPSASSSTIGLTQRTALIGRSSQSRDIHPEIALDGDTGVSRRHAQFVRDDDDLVIIDLSSTNGTYVVTSGGEPSDETTSVEPGLSTPVHDGDRVYLGAWSRLTIRLG